MDFQCVGGFESQVITILVIEALQVSLKILITGFNP